MYGYKDIAGYEGLYKINRDGVVWSCITNKKLKPINSSSSSLTVQLYKYKKKKIFRVHRLVAQTFIHNPNNKEQVDHIDGNRHNNNASNLRWCSNLENQHYRIEQGNSNNNSNPYIVYYGDEKFLSMKSLAKHISEIRGSKFNTVLKELKKARYGNHVLYGKEIRVCHN